MPNIDRFSHFYLATKQNKEVKLDQNLKKSPKCKPFEWIKQNRIKIVLSLGAIVILALVVVAISSKKNLNIFFATFLGSCKVPAS